MATLEFQDNASNLLITYMVTSIVQLIQHLFICKRGAEKVDSVLFRARCFLYLYSL